MGKKLVTSAGNRKQMSRKGHLLLASILAASVAVGTLALFQPMAPQAASPAADSHANAPQVATDREMFEQHRFLAQYNKAATANDITVPEERQMFEQHKFQVQHSATVAANPVPVTSDREMFEQHRFLAQSSDAVAR